MLMGFMHNSRENELEVPAVGETFSPDESDHEPETCHETDCFKIA